MEHRLAPEQQQTEHWRTNLALSLESVALSLRSRSCSRARSLARTPTSRSINVQVEDASARLTALESEVARQRAVASAPAPAGFPYAARTRGKTMLRKAPAARSGMVGVLDAGVEVLVEEAAVAGEDVARLRVSGALGGWGNADKFERLEGDAASEAVAARTPLPLDAGAAVRLVDGMGAGADTVRELFAAAAGLPSTVDSEAGREARARFLWQLLATSGDSGAVALGDVAMFVGRAAARHCRAQPSLASWAPRQKASATRTEEGVPPEQQHEPVSAFEARAEEARQAAARADTAAANLAKSQAEIQATMATAMASGELDEVRDALARASELESEMAEQQKKCAQLVEETKEAAAALELAQQRAAEAIASAVEQEDDEEAVAWLSAALRRCFEAATTREWSRPNTSIAVDERWLKRWLCTGPPRRPYGEVLLPWLRDLFRCVLCCCTLSAVSWCSRLRQTPEPLRADCVSVIVAQPAVATRGACGTFASASSG